MAAAVLTTLAGCGTPTVISDNFNNQTTATQAQLLALWQGAAQQIATQKNPINPVTDPDNPGYWPPDPRALDLEPDGLTVIEMPGNAFPCDASPTGYCAGETLSSQKIEIAAKYLLQPDGTGWEMQNVILERLGYNVSGR